MSSAGTAKLQPEFVRLQFEFTRHIRNPEGNPAPAGIEDRRLQIYRELLYNNVEGFIANNFPVIRKITSDADWHLMLRDYFATHRARTPLFPKMAQEFLHYLESERHAPGDAEFLAELAHYEWVESGLMVDARELADIEVDATGDLLAGVPVLSPLAWPFSYKFPVHRIGPEYLPTAPPAEPTYLVVFRDRQDDVGFMELNPVSARLLELVAEQSAKSGRELLRDIAVELNHPDPNVVLASGLEILQHLRARDVILGVRSQ